jgi:hypothetical protein
MSLLCGGDRDGYRTWAAWASRAIRTGVAIDMRSFDAIRNGATYSGDTIYRCGGQTLAARVTDGEQDEVPEMLSGTP